MERPYDLGTFQVLLDALDDGYALFDRNDRLVLWNRRYQAHLPVGQDLLVPGIALADLLRGLAERGMFVAARERVDDWLKQRLARLRSGGRFQEPLSNGAIAEAREHLLPDGSLLIAVRDVTGLKRAEAALRDSEARFRDFADTASDWYWETGPDLRFTFMSDRIREFGIDPASRLGRSRLDLAADAVEDPAKWQDHQDAMLRHQPFRDFEYKMKLGDETMRYMSVSGKPVFDERGIFLGYRGCAVEITERVLAAQRLREAKEVAEAASQAKSTFLARMSHELRTPLNAIIGFASIVLEQASGRMNPAKIAEYARDIRDSGMHLLALINDILDLSKIEAGKMEVDETEVELAQAVETVLRLVRGRAEASEIRLEIRVEADLPALLADAMHVRQILLNLISNAIKFTAAGGTIEIVGRRLDSDAIAIGISDTGIGMSQADLDRIGTPFYQIEGRDGRGQEGTGLGLSLTKEMVKLHGGELAIDSELGRGTTVTITFPPARTLRRR